ncbi:ly6/PLAUR domain-containing protein 3-like [Spea bombifrons]|uniref:ly6/PLAUR domain-containing protein 3-like n=1 Tax=Spea bombifrons TaxID=233779 RepID=UPI00234A8140|nr:ly6/PLAUR domain-containing protein 3-like [Spea bombifrons]
MEKNRRWKHFVLSITFTLFTLSTRGVNAQSLECFSCIDRGNGGCSQEAIKKTPCGPDHDICVETVTAVETSHDQYTVLMKGCGTGVPGRMDKAMSFYGMTMYIQLIQCNTSLCNTELELKDYQLVPPENISLLTNDVQCYSCIGKTGDQCTSTNAPVRNCYNSYNKCFDGNATVTLGDATAVIPFKSCALKYRCALQSVTYGVATFEMKGACCLGNVCNQDLSNRTQYVELPPLVVINEPTKVLTTTRNTPQWLTPTHEESRITSGTTETLKGVGTISNATMPPYSVDRSGQNETNRASDPQMVHILLLSCLLSLYFFPVY